MDTKTATVRARGGRWTGALAVALALLLGCGGANGGSEGRAADGSAASAASVPRFDGRAAHELVKRQVEFGPLVPGWPGHRAMADWMEGYLRARADTVIVQRFTHVTVAGDTLPLVNVLARFRPGAGPSLLLVAHWDTRPTSDRADDAAGRDEPVPGANDGGSGTAILLALADMMAEAAPPRAVDLLFVDGEDYGDFSVDRDVFLGSRYFAANPPAGYEAEYGVLLDMVGDRELEIYIESYSNERAPEVVDRVWNAAARLGFGDIFQRTVRHTIRDDHLPLNDAGIPTIVVIDFDYPYWHTPDDTPDKLSASSLGAVGTVAAHLIYADRRR
jgi:hypothetical protein